MTLSVTDNKHPHTTPGRQNHYYSAAFLPHDYFTVYFLICRQLPTPARRFDFSAFIREQVKTTGNYENGIAEDKLCKAILCGWWWRRDRTMPNLFNTNICRWRPADSATPQQISDKVVVEMYSSILNNSNALLWTHSNHLVWSGLVWSSLVWTRNFSLSDNTNN